FTRCLRDCAKPRSRMRALVLPLIEELLAGDLVALADRVDSDLFDRDTLPGRLGRDVEGEVNGELIWIRAIEERPGNRLAIEGLVRAPIFGFLDHRLLPGGLLSVAFDGDDVRRVHRAHHVEVLAL